MVKIIETERGFTLVEVMIAIVVLTIGILALFTLQITSTSGNATANRYSTASVLASKKIEEILGLPYTDASLQDTGVFGLNGLNSNTAATADGTTTFQYPDGAYTLYWNVADDQPLPNLMTIRVIVYKTDTDQTRSVTMNYVKSKY